MSAYTKNHQPGEGGDFSALHSAHPECCMQLAATRKEKHKAIREHPKEAMRATEGSGGEAL